MLVPILMYHEVTDAEPLPDDVYPSWTVTPARFSEHLSALAGAGYTGMSVDQWLAMRERGPSRVRPVVLTFDDGFLGNVEHAIPALCERGWTATFFVISGKMGAPGYARALDWRAAAQAGMDIASHTVSHPFMALLDREAARRELADSRASLENAAGTPVRGFSWPNGDAHADGRRLLRETGYSWAATSRPAFATARTSAVALPRLPVRAWHDAEALLRLLDTGFAHRARMASVYQVKHIARRLMGRDRYARVQMRVAKDEG